MVESLDKLSVILDLIVSITLDSEPAICEDSQEFTRLIEILHQSTRITCLKLKMIAKDKLDLLFEAIINSRGLDQVDIVLIIKENDIEEHCKLIRSAILSSLKNIHVKIYYGEKKSMITL